MDTYLEDVMVNSDFDANILAAKAINVYHKMPLDVQMKSFAIRLARGSMTYSVLYEWEFAEGLRQARPKIVTKKVPQFCRLPNLLIPLTKSTSFLLVTPLSIVACKNCSNAESRFLSILEFDTTPPFIWAKWARPYRHAAYDKLHDDIYLCREDGDLSYVQLSNDCLLEASDSVGQLDCDVDCAFDTIDFSHPGHGGDLLVAAGNTGHGGLFIQIARQSPMCVQKFVNWAPVFDAVIVPQLHPKAHHSQDITKDVRDDLHLYVSSASSNNTGAVYEFRHGYEAQIGMIVPLDDFASARSVWAIPDLTGEGTYFFISDPVSSALLHLSQDGEEIYAVDDSDSPLDLSAQTLAAGYTSTAILVQITPSSVRLTVLGKPRLNFVSDFQIDQTVLVATVNEELGLVATVMKFDEKIGLQVGRILSSDDSLGIDYLGEMVNVEHEPISILVERVKNISYVIVGSSDGHLAYYRVDQDGVVLLGRYTLELNGDHISKAIESIAVVGWIDTNKAAMYCGLRSGLLVSMDMVFDSENPNDPISIKQRPDKRFGDTVVKLLKKDNMILATCGVDFWCISDVNISNANASDFNLQRIWITDQNDPAYTQREIEVLTVVSASQIPGTANLEGSLICISDNQLLICTLDRRAKAVPRKVDLPGAANRIHYSDYLKCLVVAYVVTELVSDPETGIVKRYMRPHLDFLNHNLQLQGPLQTRKPVGASGERITCILDWVPESGGQRYHFLVIGTARRTQEQKGRVIFLYSRRNAENPEEIDCSVKYIHSFDGPVRAIAAYGDSTIMAAAGNDIIPIAPKLPNGGKQWAAAARFKLTSPGVSITVRDTLLYVSTARESLVILQVVENKLELYAQDGVRHESLSHHYIGGDLNVVLVSSRGGTISAFSLANVTDTDKIISPAIAEAHLPVSMIRLNACDSPSLRFYSSAAVVYGTTMDGAIYRILTLNEKEWRLLRFIQNLCSSDSIISPLLSARKRRWIWADIEPQVKTPSSMHVNGDILSRLVPQGTDYLQRMLQSDTQLEATAVPPPKSYMELFTQLFDEVFVDTPVEVDPEITSLVFSGNGFVDT
ncbi:hypothetical protein UA08_05403 [Talaromyces atroroseus]|uniref:Uncharacterized protein n=1 Tax=Talaromyces atroroseus TaxID=1441469 RepID=A0A225AFJ5_TALAT|nr:hypothetical protein UA08_05403 [Talaromyces atroroseus]OKL59370.1 hypothetical protein UA08_05403 [Talaromyces atroroseus]